MTRLGLRLALSGGRGSAIALALAALAVGLGTAVLLFALSFLPALEDRAARDAWRLPRSAEDPFGQEGLYWLPVSDRYDGRQLLHVRVAPGRDAPVPPGIATLPAEGETWASPALAALVDSVPPDELGNRFGRIVGRIGEEALRYPGELVAISGAPAMQILAAGGSAVVEFPTTRGLRDLPPIAILLVTLAAAGALAPVAVFVATATRLSATRREQRLAALRLVGATTAQTVRLAVVEALAVTLVGAGVGVALFLALRPLVARIPLGAATWWPEAITPPLLPALLLLLAVPAVGAVAAVVGLRRVAISPLGLRQRTTPGAPSPARLVPLLVASVALLLLVTVFRSQASGSPPVLMAIGLAFAGIVGGIAFAGPWLTLVVGRLLGRSGIGGAATLLAARRLGDDPRGSFGAIAGVIMAVFVATAFLTFASIADSAAGAEQSSEMQPGQVSVVAPEAAPLSATLLERVRATAGVRGVLPVREGQGQIGDVYAIVWVASCDATQQSLAAADLDCRRPVVVSRSLGEVPAGTFEFTSSALLPDGSAAAGTVTLRLRSGDLGEMTLPIGSGRLPDLLIDPSALEDGGAALPVTAAYVTTDGSTAAQERVRTLIAGAIPGAYIRTTAEQITRDPTFEELGRVIVLGLFGTMALAGCSLVVAVTTSIADRRRQFALLRSAGMSASTLGRLVLIQGGVPLVVVAAFSALWAVVVTQGLLTALGTTGLPGPDASVILVVAGSVALAMTVLSLALPLLDRLTRPDSLRTE
jgi:hypothetical protein